MQLPMIRLQDRNEHMKASILIIGLFVSLPAMLVAQETNANAVTAESIIHDIACFDESFRSTNTPHLLVMVSSVDHRSPSPSPLYLDVALLVTEYETNHWRLICVFRHPKEDFHQWTEDLVCDSPQIAFQDFDHRPTLDDFLFFWGRSEWRRIPFEGFSIIKATVYTNEWESVLGYEMNFTYPAPNNSLSAGEAPPVIYVGGEVKNPGIYAWTNGMTLQDGISAAGGFAFAYKVWLIHPDGVKESFKKQPLIFNPFLRPGDKIICPRGW
jgi:hypothetical protein